MKIVGTPIEGVVVLEPDHFADPRGAFTPMFVRDDMTTVMGDRQILRVNHSTNRDAGTLRGFHLQLAPAEETKIVQCLRGRIHDVAIDLRAGSPTFGQCHGELLDAASRRMLVIPEGFGHAFQTLDPDTDIMYFVTGEYAPAREMNVNAVDPALGFEWPLPITCRSEKDTSSLTVAGHQAAGFSGVVLSRDWLMPRAERHDALDSVAAMLAREQALAVALEKRLLHCRTITLADAGSIYLIESTPDGGRQLRFKQTQNDSVDLDYSEQTLPCDRESIAGHVATTGEWVVIDDVYQPDPSSPFRFNAAFDRAHGYRSRSMLTVPLLDKQGTVVGVLQLINRKTARHHRLDTAEAVASHVLPFSQRDIDLVLEWSAVPVEG